MGTARASCACDGSVHSGSEHASPPPCECSCAWSCDASVHAGSLHAAAAAPSLCECAWPWSWLASAHRVGAVVGVAVLVRRLLRLRRQQLRGLRVAKLGRDDRRLRVERAARGERRAQLLGGGEVGLVDEDDVGRLDLEEQQVDDGAVDGARVGPQLGRAGEVEAVDHRVDDGALADARRAGDDDKQALVR